MIFMIVIKYLNKKNELIVIFDYKKNKKKNIDLKL